MSNIFYVSDNIYKMSKKSDTDLPFKLNEYQHFGKVLQYLGNNHVKVQNITGESFSAYIASDLRKDDISVRGRFVIVEDIDVSENSKVKFEVIRFLTKDDVKFYLKEGTWPDVFNVKVKNSFESGDCNERKTNGSGSESDSDEDIPKNPNRKTARYHCSSDSSSDDE